MSDDSRLDNSTSMYHQSHSRNVLITQTIVNSDSFVNNTVKTRVDGRPDGDDRTMKLDIAGT